MKNAAHIAWQRPAFEGCSLRSWTLLLLFPLTLLLGCASPRIAVLQNPETKQTVECRNNQGGSVTQRQLNNCIAAYEKAGYKLVADSDAMTIK